MNLNLPWSLKKADSFLYGAYDATGKAMACFENETVAQVVVATVNNTAFYQSPPITQTDIAGPVISIQK
jgi:hypothetical protein